MHFTILSILLLPSAFLIRTCQSKDFNDINENERIRLRREALNYARFLLAQRVQPLNQDVKADKSALELIEKDQVEMVAIKNLITKFFLTPESKKADEYFQNYKSLFIQAFENVLISGLVKKWPRYYYNQDTSNIVVLPEVISRKIQSSTDDFGSVVPENFPFKGKMMAKPEGIFRQSLQWVRGTPYLFQNSDLYELVQIVPLPVLVRYCELLSATWKEFYVNKRQDLSAPFRVKNALSKKNLTIDMSFDIQNLRDYLEKLNSYELSEKSLEFNLKKHILWAPGMLYYGFINRAETGFEERIEWVIGKSLATKAESIYNRILDLLDQVGYNEETKEKELEEISKNIKSDDVLFMQMKDILKELVRFGQTRDQPYKINLTQWTQDNGDTFDTSKWRLRPKKLSFPETADKTKDRTITQIYRDCQEHHDGGESLNDLKYKNLEDFLFWNILTDDVDVSDVFSDFFKEYPERAEASLTDLRNLIRNEMEDFYFDRKCNEENFVCGKFHALCRYQIYKDYNYTYNENPYGERNYPDFSLWKRDFLDTISFQEWCSGRRFAKTNHLTTDSAVVYIVTYDAPKPNGLNKKTYEQLYDEFRRESRSSGSHWSFREFVNAELQKFNTTASRALNLACKSLKEPLEIIKNSGSTNCQLKRFCSNPVNRDDAMQCISKWSHQN